MDYSINVDSQDTSRLRVGAFNSESSNREILYSLNVDSSEMDNEQSQDNSVRTLNTLSGVFAPVVVSLFSSALFLRVGFMIGNAGVIHAILQLVITYFILYMTMLSVCAIATNGLVDAGGPYYINSRTLGPACGCVIGILFYLANVMASALLAYGVVEGILDNFGPGGQIASVIPGGTKWWKYLYASTILLFGLMIVIMGGSVFAKATFLIFLILLVSFITVIVSTFVTPPQCFKYAPGAYNHNSSAEPPCGNFTGYSMDTFLSNVNASYSKDYSTEETTSFLSTFSVFFSCVSGIMGGVGLSGELKDPGKSIPKGTLSAMTVTFFTYAAVFLITAATCSRELLQNNYLYMQLFNVWPPMVLIGIWSTTFSGAIGNLIVASRILYAIAKDDLFGKPFEIFAKTTLSGNPYVAVLASYILIQLIMLIGSLNAISPLVTVACLLAYASCNLACLALTLTSAPNFRPKFRCFNSLTALIGLVGSMLTCFLVNWMFASAAIMICMVIIIIMLLKTWPATWGSISQALIFHQVRKYLLMLDPRKSHIRFWRPQMLLLVSNPLSSINLIDFVNDIKKSGLYVLGHVNVGDFDSVCADEDTNEMSAWMSFIDRMKVKAFIEITVSQTIREGMNHLMRICGLGGMKPNTVCLGFYDEYLPSFESAISRGIFPDTLFASKIRKDNLDRTLGYFEYVQMISDILKLEKNACICRNFHLFDRKSLNKNKKNHIDVWPVNFFSPDTANYVDNTHMYMLQLACILNMVPHWKKCSDLRVFLCVDDNVEDSYKKKRTLDGLLDQLRISAEVILVPWQHITAHVNSNSEDNFDGQNPPIITSDTYFESINRLILRQSIDTAISFLYLPTPSSDSKTYESYLNRLTQITNDFPPTVLVYGQQPVISITL